MSDDRSLASCLAPAAIAVAALALLAACPAATPAEPPPPGGDGGDGGAGGSTACPDLSATGDCRGAGPRACPDGQLCTVAPALACPTGRCCALPFVCRAPVGELPGGYACDADGACASGVCVSIQGVGSCLRPCLLADGAGACPEGLACTVVSLTPTATATSCAGEEDGAIVGEQTLCRHDGECAPGRYCAIVQGKQLYDGPAHGICVSGARTGETERACQEGQGSPPEAPVFGWPDVSDLCPESGLCHVACLGNDADICTCAVPEPGGECRSARCTQPCANDADCPRPLLCRQENDRVVAPDPDLLFKICMLGTSSGSDWGCFDDSDCCKDGLQRSGTPCCERTSNGVCRAPPPEVTYCRVELARGRYSSTCRLPAGLAAPGAPCSAGAECESGLCAPDGSCTSPCVEGLADHCDRLFPGSRCCGTPVEDACVLACRRDCDAGPSCAG